MSAYQQMVRQVSVRGMRLVKGETDNPIARACLLGGKVLIMGVSFLLLELLVLGSVVVLALVLAARGVHT